MPKRRVYKRDRRGRFATTGSSGGSRPNRKARRPRTRAQQLERNRLLVRGGLYGLQGYQAYSRAKGPTMLLAVSVPTGQHYVTAAASLKLATGAAVSANELHNVHRRTSRDLSIGVRPGARNRKANQAALDRHIGRYETRARHLGRADRVAGYALTATTSLTALRAASRLVGPRVRARKYRHAYANRRGLPRRGFDQASKARRGVYTVTSLPKRRRMRRSNAYRQAQSLRQARIVGAARRSRQARGNGKGWRL